MRDEWPIAKHYTLRTPATEGQGRGDIAVAQQIDILMKDGSRKVFTHKPRPGGSWELSIRYEGSFAIVEDEWHNTTVIPAADIAEVKTQSSSRYSW